MMWTTAEAAAAWGVSREWATNIIKRLPDATMVIVNGRATWQIPADTPKPAPSREEWRESVKNPNKPRWNKGK
jgi:hypothetical protein